VGGGASAIAASGEGELVKLLGERSRFAAEVGKRWQKHSGLRRVDLWAAGRHLTCDDNTVFVSQFSRSVEATLAAIRSGAAIHPQISDDDMRRRVLDTSPDVDAKGTGALQFPAWGPTTDNVRGFLSSTNLADRLEFTFRFWRPTHPIQRERGVVFVAEVGTEELVAVLTEVIELLRNDATA
jgi:hypothetical protein